MNAIVKLTWVELKLYLRNWIAAFFTLVFPVGMLFLFGAMYGNAPSPLLDGFGTIDKGVPGYIAGMIMGTTAFMYLPAELAYRRQAGVLRRFRATPLQPGGVLISQVLVNWIMAGVGSLVLIAAAVVAYHPRLPHDVLLVVAAFAVGSLSQLAMGFLLASLVPSVAAARALSMAIFYPMMFLGGGTIPLGLMPRSLHRVARLMPLHYAVNLMQKAWLGLGWDTHAMVVLLVLMAASIVLAVRTFRWE
jgi:ABC-2 type transport system permease protein